MDSAFEMSKFVLVLAIIIICAILTKSLISELKLPALAGYILIGIILQTVDLRFQLFTETGREIIHFLSEIGVIILLFHIGIESHFQKLVNHICKATLIGIGGVVFSWLLGFGASYYLLDLNFVPSLIIGVALVATSIGVSVAAWEENDVIDKDQGQLLLDIAQFDDVTGVILMGLLFAAAPALSTNGISLDTIGISKILFNILLKLIIFGFSCFLFSKYLEARVTNFFNNLERASEESLTIIAIGLVIAAIAELLGFSVAMGAFFAGLIFSRDPSSIKQKSTVTAVYQLFVPFFFIRIGMLIENEHFGNVILPVIVLVTAAFVGKFIGTFAGAVFFCDKKNSTLLSISMIPRAEVAMIIMQRSLTLKSEQIPHNIYSAMVILCLLTCVIPTSLLNFLIPRFLKEN